MQKKCDLSFRGFSLCSQPASDYIILQRSAVSCFIWRREERRVHALTWRLLCGSCSLRRRWPGRFLSGRLIDTRENKIIRAGASVRFKCVVLFFSWRTRCSPICSLLGFLLYYSACTDGVFGAAYWPLVGPWYSDEARLSLASTLWPTLQLLSSSAVTAFLLSSSKPAPGDTREDVFTTTSPSRHHSSAPNHLHWPRLSSLSLSSPRSGTGVLLLWALE